MRKLFLGAVALSAWIGAAHAEGAPWFITAGETCKPMTQEAPTPAAMAIRMTQNGYKVFDTSASGRKDEVQFMILAPNGVLHGFMLTQGSLACEAFVAGNINQSLDPFRMSYRPQNPREPFVNVVRFDALDEKCRGGLGSDPATMKACESRDAIVSDLQNKGWCIVQEHNTSGGLDQFWRPCS